MRPLTTSELLNVWELGLYQTLLEKSLHLLRVSCSAANINSIASMSIGERDVRLLRLHEWLFSTRLKNTATCPACSETVEWENNTTDLYLQAPSETDSASVFSLEKEGFTVHFRLINSHDLHRALVQPSYQTNPHRLLTDCIISVLLDEKELPIDALPATVIEALNERMSQEDPQADIQMLLSCPVCNQQWESRFDIVSYLWLEIDSWAKHVLEEIFTLSRELGWSEHDILQMSPQRRQFYIAMIRA